MSELSGFYTQIIGIYVCFMLLGITMILAGSMKRKRSQKGLYRFMILVLIASVFFLGYIMMKPLITEIMSVTTWEIVISIIITFLLIILFLYCVRYVFKELWLDLKRGMKIKRGKKVKTEKEEPIASSVIRSREGEKEG